MQTTAATPTMMPKTVRVLRILFTRSERQAVSKLSQVLMIGFRSAS